MKRAIVTPPELSPAALAELKQSLGITTMQDDTPLNSLLRAALETCEAFTGSLPIEADCEELLPLSGDWQSLQGRPVQAITAIQAVLASGARSDLPPGAYAMELYADGGGRVKVSAPGDAARLAVRFTAGLAPSWEALPDALRHGILRLAAHQHRERETSGAGPIPPAAVAALWRPWRRMRLA